MKQGQMLTELRRSNAAGIHGHHPSRSQLRRIALEDQLDNDGEDDIVASKRQRHERGTKTTYPRPDYRKEDSMFDDVYGDTYIEDYVPTGEPSDDEIWDLESRLSGNVDFDDLYDDEFDIYPTVYDEDE